MYSLLVYRTSWKRCLGLVAKIRVSHLLDSGALLPVDFFPTLAHDFEKSLSVIDFLCNPSTPLVEIHNVQVAPFGTTCKGGADVLPKSFSPFLECLRGRDPTDPSRQRLGG